MVIRHYQEKNVCLGFWENFKQTIQTPELERNIQFKYSQANLRVFTNFQTHNIVFAIVKVPMIFSCEKTAFEDYIISYFNVLL